MSTMNFLADNLICGAGTSNDKLYLITSGKVVASAPGIKITLEKGDLIGGCEYGYDTHFLSYMALEDVSVMDYSSEETVLEGMICSNPDFSAILLRSVTAQLQRLMTIFLDTKIQVTDLFSSVEKGYEDYRRFCAEMGCKAIPLRNMDMAKSYTDDADLSKRLIGYYHQIYRLCGNSKDIPSDFLLCLMAKAGKDARNIVLGSKKAFLYLVEIGKLLLSDEGEDLFGLFDQLYFQASLQEELQARIGACIQSLWEFSKGKPYMDVNLYLSRSNDFNRRKESQEQALALAKDEDGSEVIKSLSGALQQILDYSTLEESDCQEIRDLVKAYRETSDKLSSEDSVRFLRRDLTSYFFKLYENVFFLTRERRPVPKVVWMFLEFGFLDEELAGFGNLEIMHSYAGSVPTNPELGVYTFYEWLVAIYEGRRLPSKNEFDVDYETFVHEQKVKNQITAKEEEALMADRRKMVEYELRNLFQTADKVTYGHVTTFCPIFKAEDAQRKLVDTIVTEAKLQRYLTDIREKDFSLFYRETVYSSKKYGIDREFIDVEVLPDIVLMPNCGSRGIMWQEIQGRVRTTPARMFLPVFLNEDLEIIMLRMCGEYRWEMCKRVQGARWNDVTDPSLTSAYFDYAQFYRKNHELSAEAKEKIKMQQQRAKNSFKEMFIYDYCLWMMYEASGSPRLNKVVRTIFSNYIPFRSRIRNALKLNPTYKDFMERIELQKNQKLHRINNLMVKLQNQGKGIPAEIEKQKSYYEM